MKRLYAVSVSGSLLAAGLALAGCDNRPYAIPPPAPPPPLQSGTYSPPPPNIIDVAKTNGYRMGLDEGQHDRFTGGRYAPTQSPIYHEAPGHDPKLGPYPVYARAFREAFVRGYDRGYNQP